MREGETPAQFAIRIAAQLNQAAVAIQGPPGAGKTYTGARMICELVRNGARVGVTALSHKVIGHLLEAVLKAADELGIRVSCAQKVKTLGDAPPHVDEITTNDEAIDQLAHNEADVVGGAAWLWADPQARDVVDVLFVDEAGQTPLATVLAASQAGRSVVLLGDPQQLDQPQQGSHPEGAMSRRFSTCWETTKRYRLIGEFSSQRRGDLRRASASLHQRFSTRGAFIHTLVSNVS